MGLLHDGSCGLDGSLAIVLPVILCVVEAQGCTVYGIEFELS